jgi:hypothetical protein
MTFPLQSSLSCVVLSAHSHTPTQTQVYCTVRWPYALPHIPGTESGVGAHLPSVMTESPFAPSRRYLLGRHVSTSWTSVTRSSSLIRAHAPDLDSLFHSAISSDQQSLQVAVSPCCIQALPGVISANLSSDAWTPTTVADRVRVPVSSPVTSAFP